MNVGFQLRKVVKLNILSLTKRTIVSQGGVQNGSIISTFLLCETGLNKTECVKSGTSSLMGDGCTSLLSVNVTNLPIKDGISRSSMVEPGLVTALNVGLPLTDLITKDWTLPGVGKWEKIDPKTNVVEKKCKKNMMRIRRRKMKVHKRKKLLKKMKYVFAKIRQKRKLRKEKAFMKVVSDILDEGKNYNPEKDMEENLEMLKWRRPRTRVKGCLAPKSVVEDYLKELESRRQINEKVEECLRKMKS